MICDYKLCINKAKLGLMCKQHKKFEKSKKKIKIINFYNYRTKCSLPVSVKVRNDYADYDYINLLDRNSLNWLKGFNREYVNADFTHSYYKIYQDKEEQRIIYGLNNCKNRDAFNISKVLHKLYLCGTINEKINHFEYGNYEGINTTEDFLITLYDLKNRENINEV